MELLQAFPSFFKAFLPACTHVRRAARHESGFWRRPPPLPMRAARPLPGTGLALSMGISPNLLENADVSFQQGAASFMDTAGATIGVMEFGVYSNPGRQLEDEENLILFGACEDAYAYGEVLADHFGPIAGILQHGPVLILQRIEFLPNSPLKGLGMDLGLRALLGLHNAYAPALILWQPFPLQYFTMEEGDLRPGERADEFGFQQALTRLRRLYETKWHASHVGDGSHMFHSFSHMYRREGQGWRCVGQRAYGLAA